MERHVFLFEAEQVRPWIDLPRPAEGWFAAVVAVAAQAVAAQAGVPGLSAESELSNQPYAGVTSCPGKYLALGRGWPLRKKQQRKTTG